MTAMQTADPVEATRLAQVRQIVGRHVAAGNLANARELVAAEIEVSSVSAEATRHMHQSDCRWCPDFWSLCPELDALESREPVLVPVPLTVSLETLWARPTVEPDYRRHVRPDAPTHEAAAWWLATVWPSTWGREPDLYRWCVANALLARREMADAGELVS